MGQYVNAYNSSDTCNCTADAPTVEKLQNGLFTNNPYYGVRSAGAVTPMNNISAACNWWGNASGPDVNGILPPTESEGVSTYVDYLPWLNAPGGSCGGTP